MKIFLLTLFSLISFFKPVCSQNQTDSCKNLVLAISDGGIFDGYTWTTFITLDGKKAFTNNRVLNFCGFSEGLAGAAEFSNTGVRKPKFGFINTKGDWVIKPKYDACSHFKDGLCPVMLNEKWGYINSKGTLVIPAIYDMVQDFYEGLSIVRVGDIFTGKYGVVNKSGKMVVSPQFPTNHPFSVYTNDGGKLRFVDGLCPMYDGEKWGYINKSGKFEIPAQYFAANYFSEGLAAVGIAGEGVSFINNKGEIKIKTNYDYTELPWCYYFVNGFAVYEKEGWNGLINKNGESVVNSSNNQKIKISGGFSSSDMVVSYQESRSRKWGVMDTNGKIVIEPKFEYVHNFIYGYAYVRVKNPYYTGTEYSLTTDGKLIDRNGNINEKVGCRGDIDIYCLDE